MRPLFRLGLLGLVTPLAACASAGRDHATPRSPLELRALQTRNYPTTSGKAVMQALLDTMQDQGLRISRTEPELGLIVAEQEQRSQPGIAKKLLRGYVAIATYGIASPFADRRAILEATAQVTETGADVRVRVALQLRVLDKNGRQLQARAVADGAAYQALFARLDKSLYLRNEGL